MQDGNRVSFKVYIVYAGPGATPANIRRLDAAIRTTWTNKFGKYDVTTVALRPTITTPAHLINYIEISKGGTGGNIYNVPGTTEPGNRGQFGGNISDWGASHEFVHLAGLKDPRERWTPEGVTRDDPDIVDMHGMPPLERTIDAILKKAQERREEREKEEKKECTGSRIKRNKDESCY